MVLASRNPHKLMEVERVLGPGRVTALPDAVDLGPETGATFAANALAKARAAAAATGRVALADDSGIEADALGGGPGVRSARYAGEDASDAQNLARLIREAPPGSGLRYVCAIAYVDPRAGVERVFEGSCEGRMAEAPRGAGGFGYDPVFVALEDPSGRTMAQLEPAEKDALSHRGRALRAFAAWLSGGADG